MLATLRSAFDAKLIIAAETMTQLERMDKLNRRYPTLPDSPAQIPSRFLRTR